ncbi:MAG: ATP-binding protein [Patescibacteria group bacterium]
MKKLTWRAFLNYVKFYLSLQELRLFWIFIFVVAVVSLINYVFLPASWALIVLGFFIIVGITNFTFGLRFSRVNNQMKVERNQLTGVIISLKDGLVAYDPNFKIILFNRAAEEIFDLPNKEVIGQVFDPNFVQKPRYRLLAQTMFPSLAPIVVRRSSTDVWPQIVDVSFDNLELRVLTSRIVDSAGGLLGFFKIISDRTREKELLRSKSEFITIAAHQLRTPLTGINWTLETLAGNPNLPVEQGQVVKDGLVASQRLLRVVNDLLDVAKIEEGRFGYEFDNVDLIEFISTSLASAAVLAKEYGIKIYFEKPENGIICRIDPNKLKLAFSNLVDNAIKYNITNGEVSVKIEKLKDKPFAQISVKDTGIGIPPEEISWLFMKFYRGSNVVKVETTGSGLGLYITKNIIRRHGGELWAESVLERGTTFYFTLPTDPKLVPAKEVIYEEGI